MHLHEEKKFKNEKGESLTLLELNKKVINSLTFHHQPAVIAVKKVSKFQKLLKNRKKPVVSGEEKKEVAFEINNQNIKFQYAPGTELVTIRFTNVETFNNIKNVDSIVHKSKTHEADYPFIVALHNKHLRKIDWV